MSRRFYGAALLLVVLVGLAVFILYQHRPIPLPARRFETTLSAFATSIDARRPVLPVAARKTAARRVPTTTTDFTLLPTQDPGDIPGAAMLETAMLETDPSFIAPGSPELDAQLPRLSWGDHAARSLEQRAEFPQARPAALPPLYASFATLQILDAYSTWKAVNTGRGREANPVFGGIADSMPKMLASKAAATALSLYAIERLWKRNRTAAIVTMVSANAAYGVIVAHNFAIANGSDRTRSNRK